MGAGGRDACWAVGGSRDGTETWAPGLQLVLLREAPGGWCAHKRGATIGVGHKKKVDLGVLRGADHNGLVPPAPFSTVDGASVEFEFIL